MYTSTNNTKKQKSSTGYLVRPRLGGTSSRNAYSKTLTSPTEKKKKTKKFSGLKMEYHQRPDYADTAYREAVSRLRILLAESYIPMKRTPISRDIDSGGEGDNQSLISAHSRNSRLGRRSYYEYFPIIPRRYNYYAPITTPTELFTKEHPKSTINDTTKFENTVLPPELMSFVEKQENYIEQLEKESRFCREELSSLLAKVKDVISENTSLHQKQKTYLLKSVSNHLETETDTETDFDIIERTTPIKSKKSQVLEGPAIVYESRISELEAQLTQAKIDLKEALEKNESYRKKLNDENVFSESNLENYKNKIDNLQREKETLQEAVTKLQETLAKIRNKENDTCKHQRTFNVTEQAQFEKNAAELEVRRLKDELDRLHNKLRETISDQTRRIAEERNAVERRYNQHVEQLTAELGIQWETINKLQLELDKQRRENADLSRELAQKQALIDEIKKETQNKIMSLRSEFGASSAEKSALEQQIANLQLAKEKQERQSKQEQTRLQDEIQSLRQRLDRADIELIHSKRENLRLTEQIASLEKEIKLSAVLNEAEKKKDVEKTGEIPNLPASEDHKLARVIHDMETKHAAAIAEFEDMIQSQNQLMDKLSNECHTLKQKLESSNLKHKEEIRELQTSLDRLNNRLNRSQTTSSSVKDEVYTDNNDKSAPTQTIPIQSRNLSRNNSLGKESLHDPSQQQTQNQQYDQYTDDNQMNYLTQEQYDQQYSNDPSYQQYQYDPNQQYDMENSSQYLNESNQPYTVDPNQQYTADGDPQLYNADQNQETNQGSTDR